MLKDNYKQLARANRIVNSRFSIIFSAMMVLWSIQPSFSAGINSAQLDQIIKSELPTGFEVTMQMIDLQTGKVIAERNPDLPLVPASTMKVVTSAAALSTLGPEFTFPTHIYADDQRGGSVGDLYIRGFGDPYLVNEELFALARNLKDRGLTEIRGKIIVDDSYFQPEKPLDENEKLGPRSYHAPYGALSLNFNSVKFMIKPGQSAGKHAEIFVDPPSEHVNVKSSVKTVNGATPAHLEITKSQVENGRETIFAEGTIGVDAPVKGRYVNVSEPALYTGYVLKEFLLREGIQLGGRVSKGKIPENAKPFMEFNSRPLAVIIYGLNKYSNNFMAEQISLAMGAQVYGPPGTRDKGLSVMRSFLQSLGVKDSQFELKEASGLSRGNRISSSALVKVLLNASRDFGYNAEFMASFGISGIDGTMKEKFTDPETRRRLRAKTGTLKGVNALAGYGVFPDSKAFAFAVIVNSQKEGTGIINYGDRIMRAVMELPVIKNK